MSQSNGKETENEHILFGIEGHDSRALLEPFLYVANNRGKGVRRMLIDAFNLWLHCPEADITKVKEIVAVLHNSSLLIDDIEDGSKMRRGAVSRLKRKERERGVLVRGSPLGTRP